MARILIATTPASGHVSPVLPIARTLVARGHEVWWYTGRHFAERITALGAHYQPMQAGYDHSGQNRSQAFPQLNGLNGLAGFRRGVTEIFLKPALGQMRDLLQLLQHFPADVLVADETCYGAGLAHELSGCPFAMVATSIYVFNSRDTAPIGLALSPDGSPLGRARNWLARLVTDHLVLRSLWREVDALRAAVGLARLPEHGLGHVTAPPELYLLGTVPGFEYPRSDLFPCTHFVGPLIPLADPGFAPPPWWDDLRGDRPVVHVTQGTVTNFDSSLLAPAIRALADEQLLVVATTGGTPIEQLHLGALPANVRVVPYLPHATLLPHVNVMVTNGGYGGVQAALANGVPLVVAGATEEKPEVAAHVTWAGLGLDLHTDRPDAAQIRGAVRLLLDDPRYRARARQLQREAERAGGPAQAAELIEQLAHTRRPVLADGLTVQPGAQYYTGKLLARREPSPPVRNGDG